MLWHNSTSQILMYSFLFFSTNLFICLVAITNKMHKHIDNVWESGDIPAMVMTKGLILFLSKGLV